MRSPFDSEQDAFRSVLLVILALVPVVLAASLGPSWLAAAVAAVVLGALALHLTQRHMRKLRAKRVAVKMAPPHVGLPAEHRVLVVANETLDDEAQREALETLARAPGNRVLVLVPASMPAMARLTGSVDSHLDEARARLQSGLARVRHDLPISGEIAEADPLRAIEDTFATFAPDEIIVSTRPQRTASGLEPQLAGLVRERFAVPVRHVVFEPGSPGQEAGEELEAGYRSQAADAAARSFGLKALAGAGIAAAVLMASVALIKSGERDEARAAAQAAAEQVALPPVAKAVDLSVIAEYKRGPEGEKHDAFTTTEFRVRPGQPQQLNIDNTDTVPHSITAPGAGINIVVMPGRHTYTLVAKRPGTYLWFCTFVCDEWAMEHPGYMSGYITVV